MNYPIKLNDKLSGLYDAASSGNMSPSKQVKDVFIDLSAQVDVQLNKLNKIVNDDLPKFNQLIREKALPVIGVKKE